MFQDFNEYNLYSVNYRTSLSGVTFKKKPISQKWVAWNDHICHIYYNMFSENEHVLLKTGKSTNF